NDEPAPEVLCIHCYGRLARGVTWLADCIKDHGLRDRREIVQEGNGLWPSSNAKSNLILVLPLHGVRVGFIDGPAQRAGNIGHTLCGIGRRSYRECHAAGNPAVLEGFQDRPARSRPRRATRNLAKSVLPATGQSPRHSFSSKVMKEHPGRGHKRTEK